MDTFATIVIVVIFIVLCIRFANYLIKPLTTKMETKICPFCKSRIPKDAVVCKYCQREIKQEKKMTDEDVIAQWELREEAINKVMDKFRSEYPKIDFHYDTTLGDIIINIPSSYPEPKLKPDNIQLKMIEELKDFGVDAEARVLSKDRIKTRGFLEGTIEKVLVEQRQQDTTTATKEFHKDKGGAEFPHYKDDVFEALMEAIPTIKGMKIDKADKLSGHILAKAGVSLRSWGENIQISLMEVSVGRTRINVTSTTKIDGAFDLGKNMKNIEIILEATSTILRRKLRT